MQNPGWVCRWCEPWKNQARDIVMPEMERIQKPFKKSQRFKYQVTDSVYIGPNGSRLYIRGVNEDRGESARGPTSNIIVADEFGSWREPEYTVNEVLRPQLMTTNGQFIFTSSPAENLAHPYYEHRDLAVREDRFLQKTIYDNESLTPEKIREIIAEVGGEHKAAWRREYLCEPVSDPERLVIPEYNEDQVQVPDDYPRPRHFDTYVGLDLGFNDNTAVLFGYWDFLKQELVIEDELVVRGKNSKEIVEEAKLIEERLWGAKKPYMRIGDNDRQQLYDMLTLCDYSVLPTRKDDKLAAINALRLRINAGKIKIKERCKKLRYQLKVGLWNQRKTDFERGDNVGHLDAVDSLIYLHRNLNTTRNPFPANEGMSPETHWINPHVSGSQGTDQEALKTAFRPFRR